MKTHPAKPADIGTVPCDPNGGDSSMNALDRRTFLRNMSLGSIIAGAGISSFGMAPRCSFGAEQASTATERPKLGIVFFAAKWFEEVVLGNDDAAHEFNRFMKEDTGVITSRLSRDFELVECPVVTSMEKARAAAHRLLTEDVDALILCFIVWSEDEYLLPFRDIMTIRPAINWIYTPYTRAPKKSDVMTLFRNSGIVGTFEGFGVLKKMGVNVFYVTGNSADEETYARIGTIVRAARVSRELKTVKLGILPYRNNQMIVTYVDEFRLYSSIGPVVEYISVRQFKEAADSIPDAQVKAYVRDIKAMFRIDRRVTDENLRVSARASLGMEKLIFDRNLDALALSDLNEELLEVIGLRPVLYPEKLARSDRLVGIEGDLGCTTAMVILRKLTGNPVMFTEVFNYDEVDNTIVTGHAGPGNYLLAEDTSQVTITPDYELMDSSSDISGVWMEFKAKPGRVTILNNLCTQDNFQFTILGGESLGGDLRLEGYPHFCINIDPDINEFLLSNAANGTSHHWAVVHGDVREELSCLADILNISKVTM